MTLTPVDHAALMLATRNAEHRRRWLAAAAAECDRRAQAGSPNRDMLEHAAATARARLHLTREDTP